MAVKNKRQKRLRKLEKSAVVSGDGWELQGMRMGQYLEQQQTHSVELSDKKTKTHKEGVDVCEYRTVAELSIANAGKWKSLTAGWWWWCAAASEGGQRGKGTGRGSRKVERDQRWWCTRKLPVSAANPR